MHGDRQAAPSPAGRHAGHQVQPPTAPAYPRTHAGTMCCMMDRHMPGLSPGIPPCAHGRVTASVQPQGQSALVLRPQLGSQSGREGGEGAAAGPPRLSDVDHRLQADSRHSESRENGVQQPSPESASRTRRVGLPCSPRTAKTAGQEVAGGARKAVGRGGLSPGRQAGALRDAGRAQSLTPRARAAGAGDEGRGQPAPAGEDGADPESAA